MDCVIEFVAVAVLAMQARYFRLLQRVYRNITILADVPTIYTMKTKLILSVLSCTFVLFAAVSCKKETKLDAPVPQVAELASDGFTVEWMPVEGALEYVYVLDEGAEQRTVECSVSFTGLDSGEHAVKVKATATGCIDSDWGEVVADIEEASLTMSLEYVEDGAFNIKFVPSEDVETIRYAVVSAVSMPLAESLLAFEEGTLEGIEETDAVSVPVVRDSIGPYAVYAKGITASGIESETQYSQIMAFGAGLTVERFDLVAMDLTATIHDESLASSGLLVVSKMVLAELGMSIEELTETYASFGMVTPIPDGETGIVALNGYEDYDYIMGVAGFDASGNYVSCGSFSFHSDFADESLPLPGDMTIDVSEITESTARVKYVMGENTRAYYQAVMTVADYNELVEYGATLPDYDNPEDYVRDYVAVYGTTLFADDDYVWPNLLSGTDYVAVGYPMNGNGTFGYGASAKAEFTTAGTAPASVKGQSPVSRKTNVIRPLTLQEIKEVLGK